MTNLNEAAWFSEDRLKSYADAVYTKCPRNNCLGLIDGTVRVICRPGLVQKPFYNVYKRFHGLNFQTIATPDGLVAHMFGPIGGCRHDSGMLRENGLVNQLQSLPDTPNGRHIAFMATQHILCDHNFLLLTKGKTSQPTSESSTKK